MPLRPSIAPDRAAGRLAGVLDLELRRSGGVVTAVRVDVYPDGGFSRLRLMGKLLPAALSEAIGHWLDRLPRSASATVLADAGLVTREQRGRWAYYSPTPGPLLAAVQHLA